MMKAAIASPADFAAGFEERGRVPCNSYGPGQRDESLDMLVLSIFLLDDNRDDDLHRNGDQNPFDMSLELL